MRRSQKVWLMGSRSLRIPRSSIFQAQQRPNFPSLLSLPRDLITKPASSVGSLASSHPPASRPLVPYDYCCLLRPHSLCLSQPPPPQDHQFLTDSSIHLPRKFVSSCYAPSRRNGKGLGSLAQHTRARDYWSSPKPLIV